MADAEILSFLVPHGSTRTAILDIESVGNSRKAAPLLMAVMPDISEAGAMPFKSHKFIPLTCELTPDEFGGRLSIPFIPSRAVVQKRDDLVRTGA